MTIDEAIAILEQERKGHHSFPTDVIGQAEVLGVEALKLLGEARKETNIDDLCLLPGETTE